MRHRELRDKNCVLVLPLLKYFCTALRLVGAPKGLGGNSTPAKTASQGLISEVAVAIGNAASLPGASSATDFPISAQTLK